MSNYSVTAHSSIFLIAVVNALRQQSFDQFSYTPTKGETHWLMVVVTCALHKYTILIYFFCFTLKNQVEVIKAT